MNNIDTEIKHVEVFGYRSSGAVNEIINNINETHDTGLSEQPICIECRDPLIVDDRPVSPTLHVNCCSAETPDKCSTSEEDHLSVDDLVDVYYYKGYLRGLKVSKRIIEAKEKKGDSV